jgi:hypothetical protein
MSFVQKIVIIALPLIALRCGVAGIDEQHSASGDSAAIWMAAFGKEIE